MNFRERYMNHEIEFEEIDSYTDQWNFSDDTRTLREFLGLTVQEEDVWISDSDDALEELLNRERNTKILFLDLDGTLLTDDKKMTPGNKNAISKALNAGHKIVINTGRPLASAKALAKELSLDQNGCFLIVFNGGEIYDCGLGKSIYKKTIPLEYVRYIFDAAKAQGLHCQTYNESCILAEKETPELLCYQSRTNIPYKIAEDVTKALTGEPVKMLVIDLENHEALVKFQEDTKIWANGKLDRIFSCDEYLEHIAPGISKGNSMEILCRYIGIPMCNTIAAGDAHNDISMLETAAVGVVMANASEEMKEHGTYITIRDNNHDGVAEIIEKFML